MQKIHHVTLRNDNGTKLFETVVMGYYTVPKKNKDGDILYDSDGKELTIARPFTKDMAITMAYQRFFASDTAASFRMDRAPWDYNGRPVFVAENIPLTTFSRLSSGVQKAITGVDATVETVIVKKMGAAAIGKKRDASGKKIRANKRDKTPTIEGKTPDTSVKTTKLPVAADAVKSARDRIRKAA